MNRRHLEREVTCLLFCNGRHAWSLIIFLVKLILALFYSLDLQKETRLSARYSESPPEKWI